MKWVVTVFSLVYIVYFLSFIFPEAYFGVVGNLQTDRWIGISINSIKIILQVILIYKIWKLNSFDTNKKWMWTILIVIFFPFSAPYYLWKMAE